MLPQPIVPKIKDEKIKNMVSARGAISCDGISFTGKLFFRNLSGVELGLLLPRLDWREILASRKYGQLTAKYHDMADKAYELIGGAKPYGFGKVQMRIKHVRLDSNGTDFDSLIMNPTKTSVNRVAYIEKFIDAMNEREELGGTSYFERVHFERYVQSKSEKNLVIGKGTEQNPKHVTWKVLLKR
ncbi:hypothetical protein ABU162_28720 [Paenibacillus thiaminolyticus]|uniref:hypothetical protein n=1 Tax=Paenibacillus thiaminolyticus TaxID=49283 RepID=UPI0035A61294